MNLPLFTFRKQQKTLPQAMFAWLTLIVSLATWLGSAQDAAAQAPYKGSELFVYHMVGQPPFANRTPACMKFVSFTQPGLYCPPPPPSPDPPSSGGGGGQSDQGGGLAFKEETDAKNVMVLPPTIMAPPPPGGVFDAFDKDIIGTSFYSTNGFCSWIGNAARLTVCPVVGSNTIINGFFFEYGVSMTGGGAAGISTPTLKVLVDGVQVYTQTFRSSDRYNGFYAAFPSTLNTTAWEGKNVTFEVTDVREHIIDDFAIIGTNNCSGKVCLGNLVWEDTNLNGIYDTGETKKANVKIQVFRDDNDGVFELPTRDYLFEDNKDGLIAETTTDANGNYNVCLPAGSYFVRVPPTNFDSGQPLYECFPTSGPSVAGNSDEDNKDHGQAIYKPAYKRQGVVSSVVTLSVGGEPTTDGDDANTNSTIDFGFACDAALALSLGNLIWFDANKDGLKDAAETGFDGVTLELYMDTNGNGTWDSGDALVNTTTTAGGGLYSFTGLFPGEYILKIPAFNFLPLYGKLYGYIPSPGLDPAADPDNNTDNDDNGVALGAYEIVTKAITLAANTEPDTPVDGNGTNGNFTLDIGLSKDVTVSNCSNIVYPRLIYNTINREFEIHHVINDKTGEFVETWNGTVADVLHYDAFKNSLVYIWGNQRIDYTRGNLLPTSNPNFKSYILAPQYSSNITTTTGPTGFIGLGYNNQKFQDSRGNYIGYSATPTPGLYKYFVDVPPFINPVIKNNGTLTGIVPGDGFTFDADNNLYYSTNPSAFLAAISRVTYNTTTEEWDATTIVKSKEYIDYADARNPVALANSLVYVPKYNKIYFASKGQPGLPGFISIYSLPANFAADSEPTLELSLVTRGTYFQMMKYDFRENQLVFLELGATTQAPYHSIFNILDFTATGTLVFKRDFLVYSANRGTFEFIPCGGGGGPENPPPGDNKGLKLGNRVWNDVNNNGTIDGAETGIANVGLVLFKDNGDGVLDRLTDLRWDSTTTDASGYYLFDKLPDGDYYVLLPNANFLSGKALNGMFSSTPTVANPNTDIDNDDNGINPVMPKSHVNDGVASGKITLSVETEPTSDGDNNNGNMTVDFGFYAPRPNVDNILRLGNRVWEDANNNIRIDAGEKYFDGVKLTLLKDNGDLLFNATQDAVVTTTTTAGGGFYLFDNLLPGNYYVRVDKENFDAGQVLHKYRSSTGYYGANTCFDSTDKGNEVAFAWWVDGILTSYISMEPGEEPPANVDTDDGNGNLVMDFGFYRPVRLGNRVWRDTNQNGKRDTGEPDLNDVMVNVYKDDGDGVFDLSKDIYVGMRMTRDSGYYNFHDLIPGKYFVEIPSSNFMEGGVLKDLASSPGVVGENPAANNQDHGVDNVTPINGGTVSQIIELAYGTEPPAGIDTDDEDGNFTIDFGFGDPCFPPTPSAQGGEICSGTTTTLTVSGCSAIYPAKWFSDAALTTSVGDGNSFTTPVLTTTTDYYVSCYWVAACKSAGVKVTVTVNPKPILVVTNPAAVCSPTTVDLTAGAITAGSTLEGGVLSYWADASATVSLPTPSAIVAGGTYYIKVTTGKGCSDIKPVVVTVNPKPVLLVTNPAAVCSPLTVDLTAGAVTAGSTLQGGTLTYWTDATATATLATPSAITASGTYYIKVTTTAGCSDIKPVVVVINPLPKPTIAATLTTICQRQPTTITVSNCAGLVSWDNNMSGASIAVTPMNTMKYVATCTLPTSCKDTVSITIHVKPSPDLSVIPDQSVCYGTSWERVISNDGNSAAGANTYQWYNNNGPQNPTATPLSGQTTNILVALPTNVGAYKYKLIAIKNGCSDTATVTLTVVQYPNISNLTDREICEGEVLGAVSVTDANAAISGTTVYQWYNNNGTSNAGTAAIAGQTSNMLTSLPTAPGVYKYKVVAGKSNFLCTDSSLVTLTINALPTPTVNSPTICLDEKAVLTVANCAGTILWDDNSTSATRTVSPKVTTNYTVTCTTTKGCKATVTSTVTVDIPPRLSALDNQEICFGKSFATVAVSDSNAAVGAATAYQWYNNNGTDNPTTTAIAGQTANMLSALPTAVGVYKYKVIAHKTGTACRDTATVMLTIYATPAPAVNSPTICKKQTATLTVTNCTGTITWNDNVVGSTRTVSPMVTTNYTATCETDKGCEGTAVATVTVKVAPVLSPLTDQVSCLGALWQSVQVLDSTDTGTTTFQWYNNNGTNNPTATAIAGETLPIFTKLPTGLGSYNYAVIASKNGCADTATVNLAVVACSGSIGDFVWKDTNNNGTQDAGEAGVNDVLVRLYTLQGATYTKTDSMRTTNQAGTTPGFYSFTNLETGTYKVEFVTGSLPEGCIISTKRYAGTDKTKDSNADPISGLSDPITIDAFKSPSDTLRNNPNIDAALYSPKGSIGDYVWKDANDNGVQDTGEQGVANVTLYLYNAAGTTRLDSSVTNSTGYYLFGNLSSGSYVVKVNKNSFPIDCAISQKPNTGADDEKDSDLDPTTGSSGVVIINALGTGIAKDNLTVDVGLFTPKGSIGDFVWKDANNNGKQDGGEAGVQGVTVELYKNGVKETAVLTDANGKYSFTGLLQGNYQIKVIASTLPVGCVLSKIPNAAGVADSLDSDVDPTSGLSGIIAIDPKQGGILKDNPTVDAGLATPTGSIGDLVWKDQDNDGFQDANEPPVVGVIVELYKTGTVSPIAKDTTDANGLYLFAELSAGTYQVKIVTTSLPAGCVLSTQQNTGTDDTKDSDFDPSTGLSQSVTIDPLGTGTTKDNLTVDAGLYSPKGSIGDYVWKDTDNDGVQDGTESGVAGVRLYLYNADTNVKLDSTLSNATGYYLFSNLSSGNYKVVINKATIPLDCRLSEKVNVGDDTKDNDFDAVTGSSPAIAINALSTGIAKDNPTIDAALFYPKGSIGDFVWKDTNNNGKQDATENGVDGVTVELYKGTAKVGVQVTGNGGYYLFNNLDAGSYQVRVITSTLPTDCVISSMQDVAGIPDSLDSDFNPSTGFSQIVLLDPAKGGLLKDNLTIDAALYSPKGSLGDYVWKDLDNDGIQDGNESGVAGVQIELYKNGVLSAKDTTDAQGKYLFSNLEAGTYKIKVLTASLPAGCELSALKDAGTDDAKDSDVDKTTGESGNYLIDPTDPTKKDILTVDAGLIYTCTKPSLSLSSAVCSGTGTYSVSFNVSGGSVTASAGTVNGNTITGIPVGTNVIVTAGAGVGCTTVLTAQSPTTCPPAGCILPTLSVGTPVCTGTTYSVAFSVNGGTVTASAGTVGAGVITGIPSGTNVTITATNTAACVVRIDVVAPTNCDQPCVNPDISVGMPVCDANNAATYSVSYVASAGTTVTASAGTVTATAITGVPTGTTLTITVKKLGCPDKTVTVTPTLICPTTKGSLGDYVWKDLDNDGIQDSNESGVAGVQIELYKNGVLSAKDTTDVQGKYLFSNLEVGTFKIKVLTASLPAGCEISTMKDMGGDDANDSDVDKTTGESGDYVIDPTDPTKKDVLTVDAALTVPCVKSSVTFTAAPVCSADVQTYSFTFSLSNKVGMVKVDKGTLTGSNPYTVTGIPSGATVKITDSLSAVCKFDTLVTGPNCNCNPPLPTLVTPSLTACIGDTFPTLKATVVGLATVEWFATATSTTVLFTGVNYKPTGAVTAAGAMFYAQARSTDPTCPTAISTSRVAATVNAQNCADTVDLALKKSINTKIAQIGDVLTYTIKVWNESGTNATGVEVTDSIATTVQFQTGSFTASRGSAVIAGNVIQWTIGNIASNGDTVTLTYQVKATQQGLHFNTAEISKTNEKDSDSTPGNGDEDEDDVDRQCFMVPFRLCASEKVQASVPVKYTNVQWFKNGGTTPIAFENTVLLTEVGTYTFTASNQSCPAEGCCPIIIEAGTNCCPADLCVPFTIKKRRK